LTSFAIVFMQAGFALVESGGCRSKNAKSIVYKNCADFIVGVLTWWFWGFGLATANNDNFALTNFDGDTAVLFLITVAFCTTSATIVSGAVAERINFMVYVFSTIGVCGASYPLISSWIWQAPNSVPGSGWLRENGVVDFAGSGVVHLVGATAALVAAYMVGPRIGRFTKNEDGTTKVNEISSFDPMIGTIGTWILIFGWLSFNASSSGGFGQANLTISARAVTLTIIAMAAGGFTSTAKMYFIDGQLNLCTLNNAFLGSLVAITAPCSVVDGVGAFFIGAIGGILAIYGHIIPISFGIDDALDTFSVHGINGAWGLISVGFFSKKVFMNPDFDYGVFYGGNGNCLAWQIAAALVAFSIAASFAYATFLIMWLVGKYILRSELPNPLRISEEEELMGLDIKEFAGYVFPEHTAKIEELMSYSNHAARGKGPNGSQKASSVADSELGTSVESGRVEDIKANGVEMSELV
jgi:Amt family ammonium transporter